MLSLYDWLANQVLLFLPAAARLAGVISVAPGFSSPLVPPLVRVLLVAAVSVAACAVGPRSSSLASANEIAYLGALLSEVCLGLIIGLGARLLLEALSFAGQMLDLQIGLHAGAFYDPTIGQQSSPLGQLYTIIGLALFLELGGHHWLLSGLVASLRFIPAGEAVLGRDACQLAIGLGASIFRLALQVAAPVMLAMFLMDLVFALVARAVPQMNVFLVEMPAKVGVGLIGLTLCAPFLLGITWSLIEEMTRYIMAVSGGR